MKYAIKKEFGIFRHFRPPFNRAALKAAKFALALFPKGMRQSENLFVRKEKILCGGGKKITVYIIIPKAEKCPPTLLYLHGGGFSFKAAPYHFKLAKEYALRAGCAVVFPEYRTAFDAPFGAVLSDCLAAYKFALGNTEELKTDKSRIYFGGDSAGGYLCLALIGACREESLPTPQKMMLVYPVADPQMSSLSMREFTDTPMWNSGLNKKMWAAYSKGNEVFNPFLSDLSDYPPAYIETAEFDCLRDEGEELARRLKEAGVPCVLNMTKGTMHGYDIRLKTPAARAAADMRVEFLKS